MRILNVVIVVFLYGTFAGPVLSSNSDHKYSQATFGAEESSVVSKFVMPPEPNAETPEIKALCQAFINPNGHASNAHCVAPAHYESIGDAALAAINGALFNPAHVDGNSVTVLVNMMAVVQCGEDSDCSVLWRLNHGHQEDQFGTNYSVPQPIIESVEWYPQFSDKLEWIQSDRSYYDVGGVTFMVSARVDETGQSSKTRVEYTTTNNHYRDYWARETSRSLKKVDFIPGQVHSEPAAMRFYEYWVDLKSTPYIRPINYAYSSRMQSLGNGPGPT